MIFFAFITSFAILFNSSFLYAQLRGFESSLYLYKSSILTEYKSFAEYFLTKYSNICIYFLLNFSFSVNIGCLQTYCATFSISVYISVSPSILSLPPYRPGSAATCRCPCRTPPPIWCIRRLPCQVSWLSEDGQAQLQRCCLCT